MVDYGGMTIPSHATAILLTGALFLGACQHKPVPDAHHQAVSLEMSNLLGRMDTLGQVRFPMQRPDSVLPSEMNRPLRWDWTGSLDEGVRQIARTVGYNVLSKPIPDSPIVSIHQASSTAGELLNQLAAAGNPDMEVDIDILHHSIRVYRHA